MSPIFQDGSRFGIFQELISLLSYSLKPLTGLADFSFSEQCYWYLQSALNHSLKATPLSVKKPDLMIFLSFFLSSFSFQPSYPCPIRASGVSFFTVLQCLGWDGEWKGQKKKRHFSANEFMVGKVCGFVVWYNLKLICAHMMCMITIKYRNCKLLLLLLHSLHKKGAHNQYNSATNLCYLGYRSHKKL